MLVGVSLSDPRHQAVEFRFGIPGRTKHTTGTAATVQAWHTGTSKTHLPYGDGSAPRRRARGAIGLRLASRGHRVANGWHRVPLVRGPNMDTNRKASKRQSTRLAGVWYAVADTRFRRQAITHRLGD